MGRKGYKRGDKPIYSTMPAIGQHEGLLGILLGYGVESSMGYFRGDEISVASKEKSYGKIRPLQFLGKSDSKEVIEIVQKNRTQRKELYYRYAKGDSLLITLMGLFGSCGEEADALDAVTATKVGQTLPRCRR